MIIHYDLFAGIGGFSYAIDQVYGKENAKHIFVEIDPFCQAVLKKHWPEGEYWGDIREFIADTTSNRCSWAGQKFEIEKGYEEKSEHKGQLERGFEGLCILTGGFPCQPFSQAGKRRGTQDNRYLWPEMFRAIQLIKPQWVIAENVYGLLTIEGGLVFEELCLELEGCGYSLQSLIIPACAVNAPHRRDRVWIIAYKPSKGLERSNGTSVTRCSKDNSNAPNPKSRQSWKQTEQEGREGIGGTNPDAQNPISKRGSGRRKNRRQILECQSTEIENERSSSKDWERDWKEVAFATCLRGMDDGFSRQMDRITISSARHRRERLKALGNAIVPQVAIQILKAIKINLS
jgi:DNA (cytosine-5)-methyltransferase 1